MEKHEGMAAQKELQPAVNRFVLFEIVGVSNLFLQLEACFEPMPAIPNNFAASTRACWWGSSFKTWPGVHSRRLSPKMGRAKRRLQRENVLLIQRLYFMGAYFLTIQFMKYLSQTTSKIDPPSIGMTSSKPWKLSVELPLNNISIELSDMDRSAPNSFAINLPDVNSDNFSSGKVTSMILSASDGSQREKWIKDIELYSNKMKHSSDPFQSVANGQPTPNFHVHNIGNIGKRVTL